MVLTRLHLMANRAIDNSDVERDVEKLFAMFDVCDLTRDPERDLGA